MIETIRYTEEVKASKEHKCCYCGQKIVKGEVYLKSTHKLDGSLYDCRTHKHCNKLVGLLKMEANDEGGYDQENFTESVKGAFFDILVSQFSKEDRQKYDDVISQLHYVQWHQQLWFVIRYFNKLEKSNTSPN